VSPYHHISKFLCYTKRERRVRG